jgi:hypothetical protein
MYIYIYIASHGTCTSHGHAQVQAADYMFVLISYYACNCRFMCVTHGHANSTTARPTKIIMWQQLWVSLPDVTLCKRCLKLIRYRVINIYKTALSVLVCMCMCMWLTMVCADAMQETRCGSCFVDRHGKARYGHRSAQGEGPDNKTALRGELNAI